MSIDPLTGLAFALQARPGVYAVILGSGVSRAAQIPTGWGITNELIRRLAAAEGATIATDPADWYQSTFGKPIGFSDLLAALAPSRSDRRAILSGFIVIPCTSRRAATQAPRARARLLPRAQPTYATEQGSSRRLRSILGWALAPRAE